MRRVGLFSTSTGRRQVDSDKACKAPTQEQTKRTQRIVPRKVSKEELRSLKARTKGLLQNVNLLHRLRLKNPQGKLTEIPTTNYYVDDIDQTRVWIKKLAEIALTRAPEDQLRRNQILTDRHDDLGMSFKVKNKKTGNYDQIFKVPCQGQPVPLKKAHFDALVASTEPVMRALRHVLQCVYTSDKPSAKEIGIGHLPKEEQRRFLDIVTKSVYFEPALIDPVMKDYPFLSVAGFDAAIGDLSDPRPVFFEFNTGTPSGLSNNILLMENLRQNDPEIFAAIEKQLPKEDRTYEILKETMEACALDWTKNENGISVVIGPGFGNPAHPDIASIANLSGMPLVSPTDLYLDDNGDVRLRGAGSPDDDPTVTGIYGRMEESFFLQDSRKDLPIRDPDRIDSAKLSTQLGFDVEPGVAYDFKRDDTGRIIGIEKDDRGDPRKQKVYGGGMGINPKNPLEPRGSFLDALLNKKLYYSGLGGRCVDDKRVFQVISQEMAPSYIDETSADMSLFPEDDCIARPPLTYHPDEYAKFYESETLDDYAVKVPDQSGAKGVSLMVNLSPEEREEVRDEVKADPNRYIVQDFIRTPVMVAPEKDGSAFRTTAGDWRIFSMFGPDGKVRAGPNSLLLRVADFDSAYSNTSAGGGYGVGMILEEEPAEVGRQQVLPTMAPIKSLPASQRQQLRDFCTLLNRVTEWTNPINGSDCPRDAGFFNYLADVNHRQVMNLLGDDHAPMMNVYRKYDNDEITQKAMHEELLAYRLRLANTKFQTEGVSEVIRAALAEMDAPVQMSLQTDQLLVPQKEMQKSMTFRPLPNPVELRRQVEKGQVFIEEEIEVYDKVDDPFVQEIQAQLKAAGGEIRRVRVRKSNAQDGRLRRRNAVLERKTPSQRKAGGARQENVYLDTHACASFRLDQQGRPIISVDLTQPSALASLAHEYSHFQDLMAKKAELMAQGKGEQEALKEAEAYLNSPKGLMETESRALESEMKKEMDAKSPFNRTLFHRPHEPWHKGYIARMCYPKVEGLRRMLADCRWRNVPPNEDTAIAMLKSLVADADQLKEEAAKQHEAEAKRLRSTSKKQSLWSVRKQNAETDQDKNVEALQHEIAAQVFRDGNLFHLIFGEDGIGRFATDRTIKELTQLFKQVANDRLPLGPQLRTETLKRAYLETQQQQQ